MGRNAGAFFAALIGRDRPAAGTGRSFFSPLTLFFLPQVSFLPSWRQIGQLQQAGRSPAADQQQPGAISKTGSGSRSEDHRRPARRPATPAEDGTGSAAADRKTTGKQQQHRRRWRERNLRMRERSQGRRETASLAAYSENNHYTTATAGRKIPGKQRQQAMRPEPASLSLSFSPLPAPPASLSYTFLSPSVPLPALGPAGRSVGTTGSKAQNFSRYEVKKRISPRLTGKSERGSKNEFQKV